MDLMETGLYEYKGIGISILFLVVDKTLARFGINFGQILWISLFILLLLGLVYASVRAASGVGRDDRRR